MTETDDNGPTDVTLLTARTVEPGYEQDFREWFGRVTNVASTFPGHLGDGLFRPPTTAGPWVLIHRFRDHESAQVWTTLPERAALFDNCDGHHQTEVARRELSGMETWGSPIHRTRSPSHRPGGRWRSPPSRPYFRYR